MKLKYYYVTQEINPKPGWAGDRVSVIAGLSRKAVMQAAKEYLEAVDVPMSSCFLKLHMMSVEGTGKQVLPGLHAFLSDGCSFAGNPSDAATIIDQEDCNGSEVLRKLANRIHDERQKRCDHSCACL